MVCPFCNADAKPTWAESSTPWFTCGTMVLRYDIGREDQTKQCEESERARITSELTTLRTANAALVEEVSTLRKDEWIPAACLHILAQHGVPVGSPELLEAKGAVEAEVADLRRTNAELVERVERLQAWKDSVVQLESTWDAQAIAKLLGGPLGESTRTVIAREVPKLVERVKRLEAGLTEIANCQDAPSIDIGGEAQLGLHCGVEDRGCADRYEGADHGYSRGVERTLEWAVNTANHALNPEATP
jgi:hypothetical protein